MRELVNEFSTQSNDMVQFLQCIVEIESPSQNKAAVDKLSDFLCRQLKQLDCDVKVLEQDNYGNHVLATFGTIEPPILVLCHMDTVWPVGEITRRPFRVENGIAYGPGVLDMKGGIVQAIFALQAANQRGLKQQIKFFFNSDEEIGSPSSRKTIEAEAKQSKAVLVLEPGVGPVGPLTTSRNGRCNFTVKVKGRPSHAGSAAENGISAIEELAYLIIDFHELTDFEKGIVVNAGLIGGGSGVAVVSGDAWAELSVSAPSTELSRVVKAIKGYKPKLGGAEVAVEGGLPRPPVPRTPAIAELFDHANNLAKEMGFSLRERHIGSGSDGSFTAALGIPTLDGLGAVGEGSHSNKEYVLLDYLPERTALLLRLFENL